jgi:hypothetical protein
MLRYKILRNLKGEMTRKRHVMLRHSKHAGKGLSTMLSKRIGHCAHPSSASG